MGEWDFRLLPFAGITQIRFEGISHPASCYLSKPGPLASRRMYIEEQNGIPELYRPWLAKSEIHEPACSSLHSFCLFAMPWQPLIGTDDASAVPYNV